MALNDELSLDIETIESGVRGGVDIEDINKTELALDDDKKVDKEVIPEKKTKETEVEEIDESKLATGDTVELDGTSYTVNEKGELLDVDGKVFKTAIELEALIKDNVEANDETELINDIQKEIGIEVVDESGATVIFENTPEGIKSYVESVIEIRESEIAETTINDLFNEYPIVENVINHIKLNGNLDGFNQTVNRSDIEISKDDEAQQISIVKEEWKTQGKKGSVDSYIEYLKTAGTLYDASKECLATLNEIDAANKVEQTQAIKAQEEKEEAESKEHWNTISSIIDSGELLGYKLPDRITVNRNGKQLVLGRNDFKNYISKPVDKDGNTMYMIDKHKEDSKSNIEDDLLRAYLKFTGSNYSSLVNMAINKEKVKNLKLTSGVNAKKTIRLNTISNPNKKVDNSQLDL